MFEVYDNGGATYDRYTIYFFVNVAGGAEAGAVYEPAGCVTTSGDPSSMWQHGQFDEAKVGNQEQRIDVSELPAAAQLRLLKEYELSE